MEFEGAEVILMPSTIDGEILQFLKIEPGAYQRPREYFPQAQSF